MARRPLAYAIAAILSMGAMQAHAGNPILSQAWLAQQAAQRGTQAVPPVPSSMPGNLAAQTPGQLLQQSVVQQSLAHLNQAAQAVAAQVSAQQAAQKAAQQLSSPVPDGLTPGGLQAAAAVAGNPSLWQNANAPTQSSASGNVTVEVKQTAQKAILTWDSFNVGRHTTLYFNQSGGTQNSGSNDWIALNRIVDPSDVPSQIFGQIKAEGTVYLLNRNGILFGAGSQVNTHSLLASSLDLFSGDVNASNSAFLTGGIASSTTPFLVNGAFTDGRHHDVVIQQGASITTGPQGFALVAAPNVSNAGSIVADDGQAILAAGVEFLNATGVSAGGALKVVNAVDTVDRINSADDYPAGGLASNTGLLQSRRGQVHMLGYNVDQLGVALASTSLVHPGSIELNARDEGQGPSGSVNYLRSGALVLGPGSVTTVLPEKDGTTTTSSAAADAAFVPGSLSLRGNTVTFQPGSLLEAPGANLAVSTQIDNKDARATAGRIYVDSGATIDVSGLANVELPISALLVTIPRIGQNELADSPLLRNSFLYTQQDVVVDSSISGTDASGLSWIGSPILNVAGYVENVPRDVTQLMTNGGSIDLSGYEVIVRSGAKLNLDGGYLAYQPGLITTPNLLGADGRVYNIANANPDVDYVGFAGQYTVTHSRWGITQNYSDPLLAGSSRWDDGFAVGGNAGTLSIEALNALALDGKVTAQAFAGRNQVIQGTQPLGGTLDVATLGADSLLVGRRNGYAPGILLQQSSLTVDQLDPLFHSDTPWQAVLVADDPSGDNTDDLQRWLPLSADWIGSGGFSSLNVTTNKPLTINGSTQVSAGPIQEQPGTVLDVIAGGSIQLTANRITVLGELSAPAGAITLTSTGAVPGQPSLQDPSGAVLPADITIGDGAVLSARGLWVNDTGATTDNYIGDRYINGGSISLVTEQSGLSKDSSNQITADSTGSILLQPGSLLDVSSGGYVDGNGQLQLTQGVPDGHGGNISLVTYAKQGGQIFGSDIVPPAALDAASIELGGTLRSDGFSGGGTLTLQAADLQIGGSPDDLALSNGLYLNPGFFAGQGFDNYALTSVTDARIAPGASVTIGRDNLLPNYSALLVAPTGTDIYPASGVIGSYTSVGQLDAYQRYMTRSGVNGFSLTGGLYQDFIKDPAVANGVPLNYAGVTGTVTLGNGAAILADAGAAIQLAGSQSTIVDGSINAPGGTVDLSTVALIFNVRPSTSPVPQLWLGPQAVLDVAGTSLIDPLAAAVPDTSVGLGLAQRFTPRTGTVLNGGNVTLAANGGYVLTAQGSLIDVSGAADVFDLSTAAGTGNTLGASVSYLATPVWSDAGSIVLSAGAGLYADGSLRGNAGASQAEGGSLQIAGLSNTESPSTSASAILLQQSGLLLPTGLSPDGTGAVEPAGASGVLHFALDRLDGSGITSLMIGPDISAVSSGSQHIVPVGFAGNIDLSLGRSFSLYSTTLKALPAGSTDLTGNGPTDAAGSGYAQGNGSVTIAAPYVQLSGLAGFLSPPLAGDGVLRVNADFIDLGGSINLQQWSSASFTSSGDIRFYTPPALAYTNSVVNPGALFSTGDLTFQAAQLYPVSNYAFAIDANGSGLKDAQGNTLSTTLSILGNGASSTPLSAGGTLLLDASHIEQAGTLRAPSGSLLLGVQDPSAVAAAFGSIGYSLTPTQSVHLAAGSITSVSLDGITVPYGTTVDGQQLTYSGDPNAAAPNLTAPPSKSISIAGANLALDAGATVDLTGGGHLQASEWIPGIGGSRDVLSQYQTSYATSTTGTQVPQYSDGRAIYAIVPGYAAPLSAHDAALEKNAGGGPAIGQAVYLSGVPGLPAGMYTLLPAKYATLPGAYRLVQDTGAQESILGRNTTLPDGTLSIAGYFADALDGARDARNTTFLLQSAPVWQQYSQYKLTDADSYFTALATKAGTAVPYLPQDGGHLLLAATQQLSLGTTLSAAPASGGRGSQVDIAAQSIQVLGSGETARAGYLQLSADDLTRLGAGSLLLGGSRQMGSGGYQIDSIADSVVLSNDSADPLAGQEILLVTNGNGDPAAQGIVLEQGSSLIARGTGIADATPLVFGSTAGTDANGNPVAAVAGNGALLRVSQNGEVNVVRNAVTGSGAAQLTLDAGADVQGGSALTLDSTGSSRVDPGALFSAQSINVDSNLITFVGTDPATTSNAAGLVIGPSTLSLLSAADQVTLNSRGNIDFLGDIDIDLSQAHTLDLNADALVSDGGRVSIETARLGLGNATGPGSSTFAAGNGQLTLSVGELDFTAGTGTLQGFGAVTATASQGIAGEGIGGFNFGNLDVSLNTPLLLAESGASTTLTTTGALSLNATAGTPLQRDALGGALSLSGGSLTVSTNLAAAAGNLSLNASSGDLTIAGTATLNVAGLNRTFFDTTTYAEGGQLKLVADQGSVIVQPGANLDFAGASLGGDAGRLIIQAAGQATLDGTFEGQAVSGYRGGYFSLGSGDAVDLDQIAQLTGSAGTTGGISVSSGAGNLVLSSGQNLLAQNVYLAANGGIGAVSADAGQVQIDGTINVSGAAAGSIQLYGRNGVDLQGSLLATSSISEQLGGNVSIATSGTSDGTLNAAYGYENVQPDAAGLIQFGPHARIDVSGGSADAGGTVSLRAPLLANGDVPISFDSGGAPLLVGAASVTVEPYAIWSTTDAIVDPAKHFDGLIDPSGWYVYGADGKPVLVAGTWIDASGASLPAPTDAATLSAYLSTDYFTPDQGAADAAHQTFYGYLNGDPTQGVGTLMGYVQQPGYTFGNRFAGIANVQLRPGIELINPDATINAGDISVLTNWNLGAGITLPDGTIQLAFRYQPTSASGSGEAPIISVLAQHDLNIDASITDGFYQQNNGASLSLPAVPSDPGAGSAQQLYNDALAAYQASNNYLLNDAIYPGDQLWQTGQFFYTDSAGGLQTGDLTQDPYYQPVQAPLAGKSADYYKNYMLYIGEVGAGTNWSLAYNEGDNLTYLNYNLTTRVAPQPGAYPDYSSYVAAYQGWLTGNFGGSQGTTAETPSPLLLPLQSEASSNYTLYSSDYGSYIGGFDNYYTYVSTQVGSVDGGGSQLFYAPYIPAANETATAKPSAANNSPSNMPTFGSPASLASATLLGGSSSSYRLVAGANFADVDPLSVLTQNGNVNLDGHFAVQDTAIVDESGAPLPSVDDRTLEFPTTIRTGTGSIDIATAGDIDWLDQTAPAVVYTAGAPADGTSAATGVSVSRPQSSSIPDLLVTGLVNPDHAGNVTLSAQGSINSIEQVVDTDGSITGTAGTYIGQFWWPWMQTGNAADGSRSSIDFANFNQGVMSVGGNVSVTAGNDIRDLSVSLPTTWYVNPDGRSITTVGGGNLSVDAGGDILSGSYFVARGQGSLAAGGLIGSDLTYAVPQGVNALGGIVTPVATVLALQDAQWNVQARQGADVGGIFNPSYGLGFRGVTLIAAQPNTSLLPASHLDGQSYSSDSAVSVTTTDGDLSLDSLSVPATLFSYGSNAGNPGAVLPATLDLAALNGNVNILGAGGLYPSATGNLSVLAADSVNFAQLVYTLGSIYGNQGGDAHSFGLIDADASVLPSPLNPSGVLDSATSSNYSNFMLSGYLDGGSATYARVLHAATALHGSDTTPVRIYALDGDIVDGTPAPNGLLYRNLLLEPDKPALIQAGRDIVDLSLIGQHERQADITRVTAGRDIYDTAFNPNSPLGIFKPGDGRQLIPSILLDGPGSLLVQAGRDIGPLTSQADVAAASQSTPTTETGIETVGNLFNPYLPREGASVSVLFGVGPGIDTAGFISRYVTTPGGLDGFGSLLPDLIDFMQQREAGEVVDTGYAQDKLTVVLDAAQAQAAFSQLPAYVQQLFVDQELFKLLATVGADYNDPASPNYLKYARGYAAIDTLFPAALGYTANGSGQGGLNGAAQPVDTGDLDIRSSTIQTQQGGDVSILGPGGQALIGSVAAPPVIINRNGQVVAGPNSQGVLTLEQGNVNLFTDRSVLLAQSRIFTEQGGDLTIWSSNGDINAGQGAKTTAELPPPTYLCDVDASCLIDARGQVSGAGIATLQTIPGAPEGNVYLIAPRGTVDAGDAGIRVSGNIVIAAAQVANADNIQVQGQKIGIPVTQSVNLGALNAASAAAGAVSKVAEDMSRQQQNDALSKQPSVISVQVLGFGDGGGNDGAAVYDPNSPVQILGAGPLSESRKKMLTAAERQRLAQ